ncbi:MAG: class I SAM-dependent methyltransferase [Actinomycetota bacterium]
MDLYRRLPVADEAEIIHAAIPEGSDILELGCGAGRVTHPLIELGHQVTAVDQSEEMLASVQGAERIHADIETIRLNRRFAAVVLGSHLVNDPDDMRRLAYLATCRHHVEPQGAVIIERYAPDLNWRDREGVPSLLGSVVSTPRDVRIDGTHLQAVMEYTVGSRIWTQAFEAVLLDDDVMQHELSRAGLLLNQWLDAGRKWLRAGPRSDQLAAGVLPA